MGWPVSDLHRGGLWFARFGCRTISLHRSWRRCGWRGHRLPLCDSLLQEQNAERRFSEAMSLVARPFSIDWLNPAEMFGDSMTEGSYVECTASCLRGALLARPSLSCHGRIFVIGPIARRQMKKLRSSQYPNGAWPGVWGVRLIYGTLFGVRRFNWAGGREGRPIPKSERACCVPQVASKAPTEAGAKLTFPSRATFTSTRPRGK